MQKQDFYGLPRSLQDRFIGASLGASAPIPLGYIPRKDNSSLFWGLGALVTAGLWAGFTSFGLGNLHSSFAITTLAHRLVHVVFAVLAAYLSFRAYARSWLISRMPYQPGVYLFSGVIVDASFGQLVIHEAASISNVQAVGSDVVVSVGSGTLRFPQGSADLAGIAAEKTQVGLERWKASQADDHLERARLNPLVDSGIHNPLAPTEAHPRPHFISNSVILTVCVLLGLGAGFGVAVWRDSLSQKALYEAAIAENSVEGYRAYLFRGGNRPDVKRLLLPRAELREAVEKGSVEAIENFVKKNPDTEIAGEVHNALRAALLVELEKAKKVGTIKALEELKEKYADHKLIEGEIAAARHDVFIRALESFKKKASKKDPALVPFMQQVLAFTEKNGPTVHLQVHQDFPQEANALDQVVIKNHQYYMGVKSQPSQYFLGKSARRREKALLDDVYTKLQPEFSEEIVKFEVVPLPTEANEELPAPQVPTLTIIHKEKLSGGYVGGRPRAMYLGAAITFTALAHIPGNEEPALRFDWSAWRNPDFSILVDKTKDIPDVYEDMVGGAFAKFKAMYLERWF